MIDGGDYSSRSSITGGINLPLPPSSRCPPPIPTASCTVRGVATEDERIITAMRLLTTKYGYPANGAAGIVGNLIAESGVIPHRIEGSRASTPMRAADFYGVVRTFTPEEVRDRSEAAKRGPRRPGVGIAQWTSSARRVGLFTHPIAGKPLGVGILTKLDAQVDYLITELQRSYRGVNEVLRRSDVTVDAAADEVVYRFEVPGAILEGGRLLPRTDPRVQAVFSARRAHAWRALTVYRDSL